jgi:hypothetical protein
LWTKRLNAKEINKEMFPVYGWKRLSLKAVHNCVERFSEERSKVADDARPGVEVAEATVKNFSAAGVDASVKKLEKCNSVGKGYVEKYVCMIFSVSNIACFTFYKPL